MTFQIVAGQRQDIFAALAQRRYIHFKYMDPVVQIGTETSGGHFGSQIAVGRGQKAHMQAYRTLPAYPLYFALLDHPQQLGLHGSRHFRNFIQQQRTALRLLELAGMAAERTGKRAFFMPEQYRLEQALRNGSAIDGHKRMVRPG